MNANHVIAGKALKLMFIGTLVSLIGTIAGIIPIIGFLGGIATLVGGVISLVGLIQAGPAHKGYSRAIIMLVLTVVLALVSGFMMAGALLASSAGVLLLSAVVMLGVSVTGLLEVYFVCNATSTLLREVGNEDTAAKGDTVFKLNIVCYALSAILSVVAIFAPGIASAGNLVSSIVSIIASILFVIFLKQGSETLSASTVA